MSRLGQRIGAPGGGGAGVSDHGALTGLTDEDHTIAAVTGLQTALDAKIAATVLDANTLVGAVVDNIPIAIPIAANRVVGRKNGDVTALTSAETREVLGGDAAWTVVGAGGAPAFTNGWSAFGGVYPPPRFRMLSNGQVQMSGLATRAGGNSLLSAFTLPVGYRPDYQVTFYGAEAALVTTIGTDGTVKLAQTGALIGLTGLAFYP